MKKKLLTLFGIMALLVAAGAAFILINKPVEDTQGVKSEDKLQVVTTLYPIYMAGLNITDQIDSIEVKSMTGLTVGCLHDYQLTTEDMKLISGADIMIINGGGMENFMDSVTENYPDLIIIDASEGIPKLNMMESEYGDEEHEGEEEHDDYGGLNPHVWLNPLLYINQIKNIEKGLLSYIETESSISDAEATRLMKAIEDNSDHYIEKITQLDNQLEEIKADSSRTSGELQSVIFHDSFAYLADRIGIQVAFTVPLESDTALSAGKIAEIIKEVRENKIEFLFTEQQYSDSIARQIEAETDAKVYIIDSVVTGDGTKDSYLRAMQSNLQVLQEALQ